MTLAVPALVPSSGLCKFIADRNPPPRQYNATSNFLVYGGFKVRDGINRGMLNNLIWGKPADYQVAGCVTTHSNHLPLLSECRIPRKRRSSHSLRALAGLTRLRLSAIR